MERAARRENPDLLTKSVLVFTTAEEAVVNMAGNAAKGALHLLSAFVHASFRSPSVIAANTPYRARRLYQDAKEFAQDVVA
jgi:hypothetical protein